LPTPLINLFPDGDLRTVTKKLRNLVQVNPIDRINLNSDLFIAGSSYEEGDLVEKNTVVYKCKSWPNAQWCSTSDSDNSDSTWEIIGHCEESIDPIPSAVVDERKFLDVVPGCDAPYTASNTYGAGDQVSVTSGGSSSVYQCDQVPNDVQCNQNAPGDASSSGGLLVGYC
jgi:hypothetical protein